MKQIFFFLSLTSIIFAQSQPTIFPCNKLLKKDPIPSGHLSKSERDDFSKRPNNWVCFYHACDTTFSEGWSAVEKNLSKMFLYSKKADGTFYTMHWEKIYDQDHHTEYVCIKEIDKYGIESKECTTQNEMKKLKDSWLKAWDCSVVDSLRNFSTK